MPSTFLIHHSYMGGRLRLAASAGDYPGEALTLHLHDNNGQLMDIALFLDNTQLTKALVEAINAAVATHPAPVAADPEPPEAIGGSF